MALNNYMRQGNNGSIIMNIDNLPSKGFINATKVKDIAKARILSKDERRNIKPGSPDVKLTKGTGEITLISRKELVSRYTHSNGKKITIAFLKNNTDYIVTRNCSEQYKIIKLPDNCIGSFKGKRVKDGSYIVCKADEQGNIDVSTLAIVSPNMFKKMFKIPMQSVIKSHIGSGNKNLTLFDKPNRNTNRTYTPNNINTDNQITASQLTNSQPGQVFNRPKPQSNIGNELRNKLGGSFKRPQIDTSQLGINPSSINVPTREEISKYKYRVVNQIMSINNTSQLIGYTVQEIKTNKTIQLEVPKVVKLCESKLIENVKLVQLENGTRYLQGNGIVLKNLPRVLA